MLITETHRDTQTHGLTYTHTQTKRKKWDLRIKETSKHVNPSKSQFRKFDPKTRDSLLIGKRK